MGALENQIKFEGGGNGGNGRTTQGDRVMRAIDVEPMTNQKLKNLFPEFADNVDQVLSELKKANKVTKVDGTWETSE